MRHGLLPGQKPHCPLNRELRLGKGDPVGMAFVSFVDWFEVEIGEIHVAERQYVYGEDVFAFVEMEFEKLGRQVPVVPLTPGQGVGGIVCCGDI